MQDLDHWRALTRLAWYAGNNDKLRKLVQANGPVNPVGSANAKTATASTYRPVGATCPTTCPQFPKEGEKRTCLALSGNVQLHQVRASSLVAPSIRSVIVALVQAARWGNPARLNVSGDFFTPEGALDAAFLQALEAVADTIQELRGPYNTTTLAWGYTHAKPAQFMDWHLALDKVGIVIRYSGETGPWGAVVYSGPNPAAKAREVGATYCPEQAMADAVKSGTRDAWSGVTCLDCTLCWTRPRTILFRSSNNTTPVNDGV